MPNKKKKLLKTTYRLDNIKIIYTDSKRVEDEDCFHCNPRKTNLRHDQIWHCEQHEHECFHTSYNEDQDAYCEECGY